MSRDIIMILHECTKDYDHQGRSEDLSGHTVFVLVVFPAPTP